MKKFILNNQIKVCLAIVALIGIIAVILLQIKPSEEEAYKDYIKNTAVLKTDTSSMTLDEAVFLTKNKQGYYEAYYLSDGYVLNWDAEYEDGKIFKDLVLAESLDFVKEIYLFSEYAKANGITLTEADLSAVSTSVNDFMTNSNEKLINATHATAELLNRVYTRTAYYDKLCEKIYSDSNVTVTDEEARQCRIALVELDPKYFSSPDRTAEKIVERVNGGEVIIEVASIYDCEATKGNVGKGSLGNSTLEDFCLSLKDGDCKLTSINGVYYVIYCYLSNDDEATALAKEDLLIQKKETARLDFLKKLLDSTPVTVDEEAWKTINFDTPIFTEKDIADLTSTEK